MVLLAGPAGQDGELLPGAAPGDHLVLLLLSPGGQAGLQAGVGTGQPLRTAAGRGGTGGAALG